jgi:hypothetical protein
MGSGNMEISNLAGGLTSISEEGMVVENIPNMNQNR